MVEKDKYIKFKIKNDLKPGQKRIYRYRVIDDEGTCKIESVTYIDGLVKVIKKISDEDEEK